MNCDRRIGRAPIALAICGCQRCAARRSAQEKSTMRPRGFEPRSFAQCATLMPTERRSKNGARNADGRRARWNAHTPAGERRRGRFFHVLREKTPEPAYAAMESRRSDDSRPAASYPAPRQINRSPRPASSCLTCGLCGCVSIMGFRVIIVTPISSGFVRALSGRGATAATRVENHRFQTRGVKNFHPTRITNCEIEIRSQRLTALHQSPSPRRTRRQAPTRIDY